jgi:probable biosynthetic protein (TIGR04098 family)
VDVYDLVLGLPHTNRAGLAEHLLLMQAGHFQWTSIARAVGRPLSELRTRDGAEVYGTFYFVEERFPRDTPLTGFRLDHRLTFAVSLRAFKNIAVEGRIVFDHHARLAATLGAPGPGPETAALHPSVHLACIFITPRENNLRLRVAPPANADFSTIPSLPNAENPYLLTKEAETTGRLGLLDSAWVRADRQAGFEHAYAIDPDRDSNGAALVYFANYVAFMDAAERAAWRDNGDPALVTGAVDRRVVEHRRIAYYGNVEVTGTIRTEVCLFRNPDDPGRVGIRYTIRRDTDDRPICRSEAIKALWPPAGA